MKRKTVSIIAASLVAIFLTGCSGSDDGMMWETTVGTPPPASQASANDTPASDSADTGIAASENMATSTAADTSIPDAPAGDAGIRIDSHFLSKDYKDRDVLVIAYEWTNSGDDATSFMIAWRTAVYQNGIECEKAVLCDDVDTQKQMNDIQPGITYTVEVGYVLQDDTDAEVSVSRLFGDEVLSETISLGGGAGTGTSGDTGETSVTISDWIISKDYAGEPVLVVYYDFHNGENDSKAFAFMFDDAAYQDGVECDSLVIGCDEVDSQAQLNEIRPGVTYTVAIGYHIMPGSDVDIAVTSLFGSDTYLSETIVLG